RLVFSPDGKKLALTYQRGPTLIWEPATQKCQQIPEDEGHYNVLNFSPDSQTLFLRGFLGPPNQPRNQIVVETWAWDLAKNQVRVFLPQQPPAETLSPDGRWLATIHPNKNVPRPDSWHVVLWDVATASRQATFGSLEQPVWPVLAFHPDGKI